MANEKNISRKEFLKGLAATGLAAAGCGSLAISAAADSEPTDAELAVKAAAAAKAEAAGVLSEREDVCGIADRSAYKAGAADTTYLGEAKPSKYITFKQSAETESKYADIMKELAANKGTAGPAISGI